MHRQDHCTSVRASIYANILFVRGHQRQFPVGIDEDIGCQLQAINAKHVGHFKRTTRVHTYISYFLAHIYFRQALAGICLRSLWISSYSVSKELISSTLIRGSAGEEIPLALSLRCFSTNVFPWVSWSMHLFSRVKTLMEWVFRIDKCRSHDMSFVVFIQ